MYDFAFQIWLGLGLLCLIAELLVPGLVVIFIGLGALTVAAGMQYGYVISFSDQLITFFISSLVYIFTLRLLIIHYFTTNAVKANINEDENVIGEVVEVVESIFAGEEGRIQHSDSTWPARSHATMDILKGDQVKIIGRDNITWLVEKV
jgi:inner membrane protein